MKAEKIIRLIDDWSPDIIQFTGELIATPSETDEREITQLLFDKLDQLGLTGAWVTSDVPEHPNLLYRLSGKGGGRTLLYVAHTDTKPIGDAALQWATDPFRPTIRDGKMYGLGAADMKAAIAAFVYATAALKQLEPLAGDLLLALVANEESGSKYGAHYLCSKYGLKADMAVIGEPPGVTKEWENIHLGCRGVCCFTIKVYGTQIHSSISDRFRSINASLKLAELMTRMRRELKFHFASHLLCPNGVTLNLGVFIKGGVFFGVNPGCAEFGTDIRTVPGMCKADVARDLESFLDTCRKDDPNLEVKLEFAPPPLDWIAPTEVNSDLPIAGALADASQQVLGFRPPFGIYPAGTDSTHFQHIAGIPTIPACGAGMISVCHGANEWVGVQSVIQACKIYSLAAYDVLRENGRP
ncbi:MAG: M20 family metallopeptidase [Candidatus Sulfotelmatobacter sp.]|jgi:acetylornithine deacetylase/succinyl-diaminopimelate desuccinylase-like protein